MKHQTVDRTTRYTDADIHRKEHGSNGKCDRKHPLMDTHQKKKEEVVVKFSYFTHFLYWIIRLFLYHFQFDKIG